jgi:hypothetical protein
MEVISYIITNGIAVIFVFLSWRNPKVGRVLFFLLFFPSACLNVYTAWQKPEVYQYFAESTWLNIYRAFITGWFKDNAVWVVIVIAICQLFIAISMWLDGLPLKLGALGAIFFFVCISPFGFGAAFPATLIMAFAMWFILKSAANERAAVGIKNVSSPAEKNVRSIRKRSKRAHG